MQTSARRVAIPSFLPFIFSGSNSSFYSVSLVYSIVFGLFYLLVYLSEDLYIV